MKDFRAYVYSRDATVGNISVKVQVSFPHIACEYKDEAEAIAKFLVRAFNLFPKDAEILTSIAAEIKPDSGECGEEEG